MSIKKEIESPPPKPKAVEWIDVQRQSRDVGQAWLDFVQRCDDLAAMASLTENAVLKSAIPTSASQRQVLTEFYDWINNQNINICRELDKRNAEAERTWRRNELIHSLNLTEEQKELLQGPP